MSDFYPHFTKAEMACKCGCGGLPQPELMEKLELARKVLDFPLIVSSGYRCSSHNVRVADSGLDGPHTTGLAVDIRIYGDRAIALVKAALDLGFTGFGFSQDPDTSFDKRFIHLDCIHPGETRLPRPWIWTY